MLGGDRRFHERLCWALVLPLALLALWAVDLAFMFLELALEGEDPGSVQAWVLPGMSLCGGYAAVLMGAKVAPRRRTEAALVLAGVYIGATILSAALRAGQGYGPLWRLAFTVLGGAGAVAAVLKARGLPQADSARKGPVGRSRAAALAALAALTLSGCQAQLVETRRPVKGPVAAVGWLDPGGGAARYLLSGANFILEQRRSDAMTRIGVFCGGQGRYKIVDEVDRYASEATFHDEDLEGKVASGGRHYETDKYRYVYFECVPQ